MRSLLERTLFSSLPPRFGAFLAFIGVVEGNRRRMDCVFVTLLTSLIRFRPHARRHANCVAEAMLVGLINCLN